jgi:TRAP-type transport system small permease protein
VNRLARAILNLSRWTDAICLALAKIALAGMVAVVGVQVVARYGLNAPPPWTEELARYLMVWGGLLGATAAFLRAADPAVVRRTDAGTGAAGMLRKGLLAGAVLIFVAPILYYSIFGADGDPMRGFLARNAARTSSGLGLNLAFVAAAIPVFCSVILIHTCARLIGGEARQQGSGHDHDNS